jgi:putative acetyltransferase
MSLVTTRTERPGDEEGIRDLMVLAFAASELGHHGEADLVDRIRACCPEMISLVAEVDNRLVGHILFTPVAIEGKDREVQGMGLAPMSVLPEFQRQGVGTLLIESGFEILRGARISFVIVLGHPKYYSRFGFVPASTYGITTAFDGIPDEVFMIQILSASAIDVIPGVAKYRPVFDSVM